MGRYTQRKRFDHRFEADGVAAGFADPAFNIPGLTISTSVVEEEGGHWLYVTQRADFITAETPADPGSILPDYEFVGYAD